MTDPVGILGLTGTVEQLVRLTSHLINSCKALKENIPAAKELLTTYEQLESMLTGISSESFRGAKLSHVRTVKHELDTVKRIFTGAQEEVESKTTKSGNWASRYLSALDDQARIEELEADADKIRQCIFRLSSDANINWRLNNVSVTAQEKFRRKIWAEKNVTSIFIDLNAKDDDGKPSTCESMLKEAVLSDGRETHVGAIAIGQGGVGKTCTLRAIAHDGDTDKRFPGGVYFLTLGKDATIGTIIQQLSLAVKASGGAMLAAKLKMEDNITDVVAEVQDWFSEEASLFIIDDVWTRNGIDAKVLQSLSALVSNVSRDGSRRSRILYSTRDPDLYAFGHTVTFEPRASRGDRALEILLKVAGENRSAWEDPECQRYMRAILDKCAGLPLALNVAGSAVRVMRKRWKGDAREAWKKYSEIMNEPDRFERQGPHDAYSSLYTMLRSSIEILDDPSNNEENGKLPMSFQEMHRTLCVLKRQDWVPLSIVQHLWGTVDEATTERGVKGLESVGAAELQYDHDGMGGVRLHDLTQDFTRHEAKEHGEEKKWHRKLLDKYRTSDGSIAQPFLWDVNEKEEQYLFENIYRVCEEAGHCKEICELVESVRWISSVVQNGTLWVLEQAVKDVTEDMSEDMTDEVASSIEGVAEEKPLLDEDRIYGLRKIAKAARLSVSYLNGNESNVFFQLYARLVEVSDKSAVVKRFLEDVEKWAPKPWLKTIRSGFDSTDELVEEILAGFRVDKVKFSSDGITGCGHRRDTSEVSAFTQNRRKGVNVMRWDIDASCDGPLTRELEGSSTATAHTTTVRAEMTEREEGEEGVRVVQDKKSRTVKRLLHRLGAAVNCYRWCFRRDDESSRVTCSDVCEDLVAAGCRDGTIFIKRFNTNKVERIRAHAKGVSSIWLSADGSRVVSGSKDKTVRVWEVVTGAPVCESLTGHTDWVNCVEMSADGSQMVSGSKDKTVRVWDVATGAPVCEALTGHTAFVSSVAMSADGSRVVSGSADNTVRVWDVATGAPVCEALTGHTDLVTSVAMSADGSRVVSGSKDKTVRVWEVVTGAPVCEVLTGHTSWVTSVAMTEDGSRVVSGSDDKTVRVWDVATGGSDDKTVRVWDVATGAPACDALTGHTGFVTSVAMSADGSRVVSGSDDKTVRVWDVATGAPACKALKGHTWMITSVAISADGNRVVSDSEDKTVRVWDVVTGAPVCEVPTGHMDWVNCVAMSADGSKVVCCSNDNTLRVWDVATGAPACEALAGHTRWMTSVAMSEDGSRVVSGSWDKTVRVWDVATGAPACEALTGHTEAVWSVAMSADGSRVVSVSLDKTVRVWDVATEDCLLVTSGFKWGETVARYCGSIAEHGQATSSEEECELYFFDGHAVKFQRGNGNDEAIAQLAPSSGDGLFSRVDINSRHRAVVAGYPNGRVGIFRIVK